MALAVRCIISSWKLSQFYFRGNSHGLSVPSNGEVDYFYRRVVETRSINLPKPTVIKSLNSLDNIRIADRPACNASPAMWLSSWDKPAPSPRIDSECSWPPSRRCRYRPWDSRGCSSGSPGDRHVSSINPNWLQAKKSGMASGRRPRRFHVWYMYFGNSRRHEIRVDFRGCTNIMQAECGIFVFRVLDPSRARDVGFRHLY